jgi:hypothetical protein
MCEKQRRQQHLEQVFVHTSGLPQLRHRRRQHSGGGVAGRVERSAACAQTQHVVHSLVRQLAQQRGVEKCGLGVVVVVVVVAVCVWPWCWLGGTGKGAR